ncbi:MAG: DUF4166 domain-containing protein [Chloroflexi bacterium]|nr:DUF4166 domain-containing protein [Chloroflexota bacterium]
MAVQVLTRHPLPYLHGHQPSHRTVNLYQRLLGDAWHSLPDVLKRVHGTDAQAAASGEMDVTLGRFFGAGLVRWVLRMPRTEGREPVELYVRREGERERWERRIGAWRFPTEQRAEDGLLIERYGSLDFPMTVTSDTESLTHWSDRMLLRFLGRRWPVPRWLSVHTWGAERRSVSVPGAMDVSVRIEAPWGSLLVGYEGTLLPADRVARARD